MGVDHTYTGAISSGSGTFDGSIGDGGGSGGDGSSGASRSVFTQGEVPLARATRRSRTSPRSCFRFSRLSVTASRPRSSNEERRIFLIVIRSFFFYVSTLLISCIYRLTFVSEEALPRRPRAASTLKVENRISLGYIS